jgi:hypothetical protein
MATPQPPTDASPPLVATPSSPTRSPLPRFAFLTVAVAGAWTALAWATGLRAVFHGGLVALSVFAFLPFVVITCILGALLGVGLILGLITAADGGVHASDLAGYSESLVHAPRAIRAYYVFLGRNARSVWLGMPAGILLGTLLVWLLLALLVVPRELRTTAVLLRARADVEQFHERHRSFPATLEPILDGFGRPVQYEVQGKWLAQSYRIVSRGFDGIPSDDDLCVQGQTKLRQLLDISATLVSLGQAVMSFKTGVPMQQRLSALKAVQCKHEQN